METTSRVAEILQAKINGLQTNLHTLENEIRAIQQVQEIVLGSSSKPDEILTEIAKIAENVLESDMSVIFLFDQAKQEFTDEYYTHGVVGTANIEKPRKDGLAAKVLEDGIVIVDNLDDAKQFSNISSKFIVEQGIKAFAGIALRTFKDKFGVLYINFRNAREFKEEDIQSAKRFGYYIALALQQAKTIQRRTGELELLQEIDKAISGATTMIPLYKLGLEKAMTLIQAEKGHFMLYDKINNQLNIVYDIGSRPEVASKPVRVGTGEHGVTAWVAYHRKPALISDVTIDERYLSYIPDMKSELAVPMIREDQLIGVINIEHPKVGAFTEDDQRLLEGLAAQTVVAIEKIRQFNELVETQDELRKTIDRVVSMETMAQVGDIAANFVHRLNNKLGAVRFDLRQMMSEHSSNSSILQNLEEIYDAVVESLEIPQELSRQIKETKERFNNQSDSEVLDVNESVLKAINITKAPENIKIIQNLASNLPRTRGSKQLIAEAVQNLLSNSVKAMPEGGVVKVETHFMQNEMIQILVEDSGQGISDQIKDKIFEMGYTSESKKGLGFGLWWVKDYIVNRLNGKIYFETKSRAGTKFMIELPVEIKGQ